MKQRLFNLLVALDQFLFCVATLGGSMPDETASAAAYRGELLGYWTGRVFRPLIDRVFWFDKRHCFQAYMSEVNRTQAQGYSKHPPTSSSPLP